MCHSTEYDHLVPEPKPEPEPVVITDLDARALLLERSRLLALAGLPLEQDALAFARSLTLVR